MESPNFNKYDDALGKVKRSDDFKNRARDYARVLCAQGLPVIYSPKHLAFYLREKYDQLRDNVKNASRWYHYFVVTKKRSDKKRRVISPCEPIRGYQVWIKRMILDKVHPKLCATGFVKGKSIIDNARPHVNKKYILKCDIKDFFESITDYQVRLVFIKMGYTVQIAHVLAAICTAKISDVVLRETRQNVQEEFKGLAEKTIPFLIQGSPTSPQIANLVCAHMDKRFMTYCESYNVAYTRYADDLTFSSDNEEHLPKVSFIKKVLKEEGFMLNEEKTQLMTTQGRQFVTGLLVDGRIRVPGKYKRDIYRHLHFCLKYGGRTHFEHVAPNKLFNQEWLLGKIYYVNAIEPKEAQKMLELEKHVNWLK